MRIRAFYLAVAVLMKNSMLLFIILFLVWVNEFGLLSFFAIFSFFAIIYG